MHFTAKQDKLAVLPMGYGDGFPIRNKGKVLISEFAAILLETSLDAFVLDYRQYTQQK